MDTRKVAEAIVDQIVADLRNRGGLSSAWDDCDDLQSEIRAEWESLARLQLAMCGD